VIVPAPEEAPGAGCTDAIHLLVGLADLALSNAQRAIRGLRARSCRADLADLIRDGCEELKARGELALRRNPFSADPHLEGLARRVAAPSGENA
jgi:hypothetical protein